MSQITFSQILVEDLVGVCFKINTFETTSYTFLLSAATSPALMIPAAGIEQKFTFMKPNIPFNDDVCHGT